MPTIKEVKDPRLALCPYHNEIREGDNEYCICPKCANRSAYCHEVGKNCKACKEWLEFSRSQFPTRLREHIYMTTTSNCDGFKRK